MVYDHVGPGVPLVGGVSGGASVGLCTQKQSSENRRLPLSLLLTLPPPSFSQTVLHSLGCFVFTVELESHQASPSSVRAPINACASVRTHNVRQIDSLLVEVFLFLWIDRCGQTFMVFGAGTSTKQVVLTRSRANYFSSISVQSALFKSV